MFYILYSNKTINKSPEISYANGTTLPFKEGYFLFDDSDKSINFWINESSNYIEFEGNRFKIDKKLKFKNKNHATIILNSLKLAELKKNGGDFFFPNTFKNIKNTFEQLISTYPEYSI